MFPVIRFGAFEIDLRSAELRKGGAKVRLQRQPFKMLELLAGQAGILVTRDELRAELWGQDTFVDFDQGLNFCIRQIRTALGDDAQTPRFVETLPRRGYRFIAPIRAPEPVLRIASTEPNNEAPSEPRRTDRSVAVLPFGDLSPAKDQGCFCEGIAQEILGALGRVECLRVASRASSFGFRCTDLDAREIGRRLGVAHLLDGSVRTCGDRIRITVGLADAGDGFHVWSEQYDRRGQDVFAIQEEIARAVARALAVILSTQEIGALGRQPDPEPRGLMRGATG